jgi:hypothetical protein
MDNEIEFIYIGWCGGVNDGVKNDKVWTAFKCAGKYYAGWGARGKSIRFKKHGDQYALKEVMYKKQEKYKEVDAFMLFSILPDFKEQVASKLLIAVLTDSIMPV